MSGGVSLAVWIGGLTNEVNRLVRREGVYGELLDLLRIEPHVDVVSGTSAGGINGALLALAMVRGQSLDLLQELWIEKAALRFLLRDPLDPLPSSLLRGDDYFLKELKNAFSQLGAGGELATPEDVPIDLILSATLLRGEPVELADDFGRAITDVRHSARFRFQRGPDVDRDGFVGADIADRLALSARSTASFPIAFEPSFIPVTPKEPVLGRRDLRPDVDFSSSRFVIDGGVLDNKPLGPAIESIARQRSAADVRRVLVYVVPDPSESGTAKPDELESPPDVREVALSSLLKIPRVEPVASEIREIRNRNRRVMEERESRVTLTNTIPRNQVERRIRQLARTLFPVYQARRTDPAISYIVSQLADGLAELAAKERMASRAEAGPMPKIWLERQSHRSWVAEAFRARPLPWVPQQDPLGTRTDHADAELRPETWGWGIRAVEHAASQMLDVLRRTQRIVPLNHEARRADALPTYWHRAYDMVAKLRRVRQSDSGFWKGRAESLAALLAEVQTSEPPKTAAGANQAWVHPKLDAWVKEQLRIWASPIPETGKSVAAAMGEIAHEIASLMGQMANVVRQVVQAASASPIPSDRRDAARLGRHIDYVSPIGASGSEEILLRLTLLEVVQYALGTSTDNADEYIELIQVSGNSASPFGGPDRAQDKLAGVQLGHFGAFYKRSWRANDWMYGRLDGAYNLIQVILSPDRLCRIALQLKREPDQSVSQRAYQEIKLIAVDSEPHTGARDVLRERWDSAGALRELSYLDDLTMPAPDTLPACADALARRLQLDILRYSLVAVAEAVERDEREWGFTPGAGARLRQAVQQRQRDGTLAPEDALRIFRSHNIGEEKVADQVGSDLFSATTAQTLAVASSVSYKGGSDLGAAKQVLRMVRGVTLAFYLMARNITDRSRTGAALNGAAITAGATIVALILFGVGGISNTVAVVGWTLFGGGVLLALFRWRGAVLVTAAVGVLVWALRKPLASAIPWLASDRWGPPIVIAAIAGVLLLLGSVRRPRWWARIRTARRVRRDLAPDAALGRKARG